MSSSDGSDKAHASRPHRFFGNANHQELFGLHNQPLDGFVRLLDRSGVDGARKTAIRNATFADAALFDGLGRDAQRLSVRDGTAVADA